MDNEKMNAEVTELRKTSVPQKATRWGEKSVSRKFLSIALAVALALNVALTAGTIKLLSPDKGFDNRGPGRPGVSQQFDNGRGGGNNMLPPSGSQQPNQQPNDQQNDSQQSDSQQSGDQDSSSQEKA